MYNIVYIYTQHTYYVHIKNHLFVLATSKGTRSRLCHQKYLCNAAEEFCNIISGETSMQVRAHHYATAYVEKLTLGGMPATFC